MEVNLTYTYEEIDMHISRAHPATERDITQNNSKVCGLKPIFAEFVNWRVVEEGIKLFIGMPSER